MGAVAMTSSLLVERTYPACHGRIPPLTQEEAEEYFVQAPEWTLLDDAIRIEWIDRSRNCRDIFAFVAKAGDLAETEGYHPDISFGWRYATVLLRIRRLEGLHENAFIMAAEFDRLADADGTDQRES
ncbi:MAG: 4a-hydroxytetrahydrobiopterin dehydratase [Steroidobacteraceae bacterium]